MVPGLMLPALLLPCFAPVPVHQGYISSHFGWRVFPGDGERELHVGVDIVADKGTPVRSMTKGTVIFAGLDGEGGGKMVTVKSYHRGKVKLIRYMHLSKIGVKRGAKVRPRTLLGRVGSTGRSTGPHLHIEMAIVRDGLKPRYDDPLPYLCRYRTDLSGPHQKMTDKFTLRQDHPIHLSDLDLKLRRRGRSVVK